MPNPVPLNNADHKDLRVITDRSARYGDCRLAFVPTFPTEFRNLQAHYPIVFRKSSDGTTFESVVLLGFDNGENLFLNSDGWDAHYVPLMIDRLPFLIGRNGDELTVHIDLDNPRVSTTEGEPLFLPYGGTTPFLERMDLVLAAIHQGMEIAPVFISALLEHDLLEPFVFDIELNDGSKNRLSGFYGINEIKLGELDGSALEKLHKVGYLQPIYMVIASLSNFRDLIERKNRLHALDR
jgi:hypothetical protein